MYNYCIIYIYMYIYIYTINKLLCEYIIITLYIYIYRHKGTSLIQTITLLSGHFTGTEFQSVNIQLIWLSGKLVITDTHWRLKCPD